MSNWIDWTLDVLAASPVEINKVAVRLKYPSPELAKGLPIDGEHRQMKSPTA